MRRDIRVYLEEMQRILAETEDMVAGKTQADFDESLLLTRAVERMHEIIAEVLKRMVAVAPETMTRIDSVAKITGFRNVLAHEYDQVDDQRVYEITVQHLPTLRNQIDAWAAELGMESPPERASSITAASASIGS